MSTQMVGDHHMTAEEAMASTAAPISGVLRPKTVQADMMPKSMPIMYEDARNPASMQWPQTFWAFGISGRLGL